MPKAKHLEITSRNAINLAKKVVEQAQVLKEEGVNLEELKEKLNDIVEPLRNSELDEGRFWKSAKVLTPEEDHSVLLTYKNSYQKYDISEKKALVRLFGDRYEALFTDAIDEISWNKSTIDDLKEFFGDDEEKLNAFTEKFVKATDSYVKPSNKFQEIVFEGNLSNKQAAKAEEIHKDATNAVNFTIK